MMATHYTHTDLSPVLMWVSSTAVALFCVLAAAAFFGWLPMSATPHVSEEITPAQPHGRNRHFTAVATNTEQDSMSRLAWISI